MEFGLLSAGLVTMNHFLSVSLVANRYVALPTRFQRNPQVYTPTRTSDDNEVEEFNN